MQPHTTVNANGYRPPWIDDLLAALALLTSLPLPRPERSSDACARATIFFPAIGLLLGAGLAALHLGLRAWFPSWFNAILLLTVWETAAGAPSLGRFAHAVRGEPGGALVTLGILATKAVALGVPRLGLGTAALLFAPMLGRWSMVVLAVGARDAAAPGRKFNPAISFREFALTSVFALAVVFTLAEAIGILVVLCVAGLTLVLRLLAHRDGRGISWPFLLLSAEAVEAMVLAIFVLI